MILELLQNVALLVTLSVGLQLLGRRLEQPGRLYKLAAGVLFGLVSVVAMATPLTYVPGLIYDGRSIILSLAGFIGGPLTATVAVVIGIVYRAWLGGVGAIVGVLVIIESGALGTLFYVLRRRNPFWEQPLGLWLIGIIVQLAMLSTQLLLPGRLGWEAVRTIAPSVLLLYPLGFMASALVFLDFQRRRRLETTLASHSQILEMIAAGQPLSATLERLAREIERQAPGMIASVLLLDEDGVHLRHGAAPSLPLPYVQAIDGVAIGEGVGSCGTAAWRRAQVIVENTATDPLWTDYRDLALRNQLRACWSTPIVDTGGSVLGTFALYYHRPRKPTDYHTDLIQQATHTAAIAITRYRQEEALRAERDFARAVIDTMGEGLSVTDADQRLTYVNTAFASMLGVPAEEILGHLATEFVIEDDAAVIDQAVADRQRGLRSSYDLRLRGVDDRVTPVLVTGVPRLRNNQYSGAIAVITDLSERMTAEQALRESEERYRLLVDNLPHAIGVAQDGLLVFANRATADLLGAPEPAALYGRDIMSIIAPEEILKTTERMRRMLAGETGLYPAECTYLRLDGSRVPVEVVAAPFVYGGRPAIQVIAQDITVRKRREREVQAQAQIAQALAESIDLQPLLQRILAAAVYAVDAADKGGLVLADGEGTLRINALTGYHDKRMQGLRFPLDRGYAAWSYREGRALLVDDVQADPELAYTGEIEELRSIKSAIAAPLIVRGQVTGVIGLDNVQRNGAFNEDDLSVLTNIAATAALVLERARLFEEMNTQARQMAQIMQAAPQGVLLLNAGGQVMMANRVGTRDLSILADAKVGDVIERLGDQPLTNLFATPPTGPWYEARAGNRTYEIIARPISDGAAPEQWVVLIDDVTHSRQVRQQAQLQERLATVGQLAAGIAHDFNNILSVILLQAQMAKQIAGLTEQARDRMDVIVAQTQHATDLVRQILDFSRQSMLMRQAVDLRAICIEQVGLLERALPEIITIQFEHEAGADYVVNGDATSLRQIIMNLAINARDAMPDGGSLRIALATLRYDTTRETPLAGMAVGEWVRLTVADSGFGIAADILPHIFDPFFTTKDPGKGTGLGLAQVHGIVAQHEGHLAVETAPNAGTTFHIYLPAVVEAQDLASGRRPGGLPRGGGETILLVEDNQILRLALTDMLESLNYTVVDASNGREALARRTEHGDRIAVVLSDVVMPEMGGIALAHALRMNSFLQPIILMSGHPLDEDTETLQDAGVKTWLSKPCTLEDLAQALAGALNRPAAGSRA